jgi:hypothetical protein
MLQLERPAHATADSRRLDTRLAHYAPLLGVVFLGFASVLAHGGDALAKYPRGDGGLFYAICDRLIAGNFAYPREIDYNGFQIPFSYSPLAFYCVALIARALGASPPHVMNLWVIGWDFAFAPATYWAALQFLKNRRQAFVATAFLIVCPGNLAYLGMGGAMTRAPGFAMYLLACGATWRALRERNRAMTAWSIIFGALAAWTHMEFLFLYVVSAVLIAASRPSLETFRRAVLLLGGIAALAVPWLLLAHFNVPSIANALRTTHGSQSFVAIEGILRYFGLTPVQNWVGLLGFVCLVAAYASKRKLWLSWALALVVLDSRGGLQAAYLPLSLAVGWASSHLNAHVKERTFLPVAALIAAITFEVAAATAADESSAYPRLDDTAVASMTWMARHLERNARVFTESAARPIGADQAYEWLPVFAHRKSPITYQGLEWVDVPTYRAYQRRFYMMQTACVSEGADCFARLVDDLGAPAAPAYLWLRHDEHGADQPILRDLRHSSNLTFVRADPSGSLFRLELHPQS